MQGKIVLIVQVLSTYIFFDTSFDILCAKLHPITNTKKYVYLPYFYCETFNL